MTDNRISADNIGGDHTISWEYDALGRVSKVVEQDDYEIRYTYRADGQRSSVKVVDDDSRVRYHVVNLYDRAGRLEYVAEPVKSAAAPWIAKLGYDTNGNRSLLRYYRTGVIDDPNTTVGYTYNDDNLLSGFSTTGGPTFSLASVTVDGLGRLIEADETLDTVTHALDYTYDMRSQLTSASVTNINSSTWTASYTYDKAGNVQSQTINSMPTSFTYDGDVMTAKGANGLDWDENGRMIESITSSLTYNWDGKLRSAGAGQATVDCLYDPDGNRIYREVDDESTTKRKYIVDTEADLPVVLLEIDPDIGDPNDSVVKTYLYANEQIIAQHDGYWGQDVYFYLHDRLGSVRQMIDNQANVKNTYTYEPFGTPFASEVTENVSNPWTYTGQYYDSEIAQYYLRARQYDPALYCFGSRDPEEGGFMESLTLHRYLYCMNDPINQMDLTGRAPTNTQETASTVGTQAAVGTAGAAGTNYQTILERIQNFANFESFRNKALEFASQSTQGVWNWARTVGRDVHHIVARGWGNVDKFGREVLNSFDNLISLPRGMHQQITQFFNQGARYHDFLKGYSGSLQNVISELPYAEQLDWGLAAMDYILTNGSMAEFNPIMYGLSLPVQ